MGEVVEEVITPRKDVADKPSKKSQQAASETTSLPPAEWRGQEAALSVVISRLEQVQSAAASDEAETTPVAQPGPHAEPREMALAPGDLPQSPTAGDLPQPRFALVVESADTRTMPPIKVAVREQETHFEPVQPTLLQKIVDRMGAELPAAATQVSTGSAEFVLPDLQKPADRPVRILTLQLDPPDLGAVTVKMRLTGDAVEIRLTADSAETTQLLQRERTALSDIMQSAGYKFDIASIDQSRSTDTNAGAGQQQPQSDQRQSSPQPNGGSQINDANSERQPSDAQAGTRQNRQQHEQFTERGKQHQNEEAVRDRSGGAVYL